MNHVQSRPGAAVIAIALFVTVIGMSSALFFLSGQRDNLRETTYNVQRKQAQNCMESGVQIALQCIQENTLGPGATANPVQVCSPNLEWEFLGGDPQACQYEYSLSELRDEFTFSILEKDQTDLIILDALDNGTETVKITWETMPTGNILEVNAYTNDGFGGFNFEQTDYSCIIGTPSDTQETGRSFVNATQESSTSCSIEIDLTNNPPNELFLQITSRYETSQNVHVKLTGGQSPLQGYEIVSEGKSGEVQRRAIVDFYVSEAYGVARAINNSIMIDGIF